MKMNALKCWVLGLAVLLAACGEDATKPVQSKTHSDDGLVGCYTIEQGTAAQIWLHRIDDKLVMQMKEPTGSQTAWDKPEAMDTPSVAQGFTHFSTNRLDVTVSDVQSIAVRPDGVFAIARLSDAAANTNPLLDSPVIVQLFGAVNTIYQAPCQ